MVNKYICMGYVAADPAIKKFQSGKVKANFTLGVSYGKDTTWVDFECWDKMAENCQSFLNKGDLVFVEGKLKYLSWTDSGSKKTKLICVCDFFKTLKQKNEKQNENKVEKRLEQSVSVDNIIKSDIQTQEDLEDIPW